MFRTGRTAGRMWRIWVAWSLILSLWPFFTTPVIADVYPLFELQKTADPSPVFVLSPMTYTLTIKNVGGAASLTTTITDVIPSGVTLISIGQNGTLTNSNTIKWVLNEPIDKQHSTFITFTVQTGNVAGIVVNETYGVKASNGITTTHGVPLTTTVLPDLVINEVMQNPSTVDDSVGEWFELYNPTDADVDINGWTIRDAGADSHTINNGGPLIIPSLDYLVLGRNGDFAVNGGVMVDYVYSSFVLSNSDDEIILQDAAGHEIDRVEYDGGPAFPDPTGASMELVDPALDNNDGSNWAAATIVYGYGDLGTPGGPNGVDTLSPFVRDTTPNNGATNVGPGVTIEAVFNEDMDETTITADVFTLIPYVPGVFSYNDGSNTLTFNPDADLIPNTTYTAIIAGSVTDQTGNPMGDDYSWSFTISEGVVLPNIVINEIMQNPATVSDSAGEWFELYNAGATTVDINGWTIKDNGTDNHVINNGSPLEFVPGEYLVLGNNADPATNGGVQVSYKYPGSWYLGNSDDEIILLDNDLNEIDRVEYDGGPNFPNPNGASMALQDPGLDNNVGANWYEETVVQYGMGDYGTPGWENGAFPPEDEPPYVVSTAPDDGATDVSVDTNVRAILNEAINEGTLNLTLTGPAGLVAGVVSYEPASYTATFDPDASLDFETTYTATVAAGLEDLNGNATVTDYTWGFTTVATGPTIVPIHDIQYTEDPSGDSPYLGQVVTTEGVVVAIFDREIIIADPAGGPWSGLLIYADPAHGLSRDDTIRVTGEVIEFDNMTEIGNSPTIELLSPVGAPAPSILPTGDVGQEAYEAVLVQVRNVTVTDPDLGYGEWLVDDGGGGVRVDDKGSCDYQPQQDDRLDSVTGPVFYTNGDFKIEPRDDDDIVPHIPAPVLISEVQVAGGTASDEFIELYNPSATAPFNLKGFRLVYRAASGTTDFTIASWETDTFITPYSHYLLTQDAYDGPVPGDRSYSRSLAGEGGSVALRQDVINVTIQDVKYIIDSIGYGTATNEYVEGDAAPAPPANQSIERRPGGQAGNMQDTNNNSADFQIIDPPNPQNTASPPTPAIVPVIMTVAEARAKPDDTPVIVEGIATAPSGIYYAGSGNTQFYLQDATGGAQIQVFGSNGPLPQVTLGDRLLVGGVTGHYRGEFQIMPQDNAADITVTDGNPEDAPPPREVAIADVGEDTEGWLIALEGLVVDAWASDYGYNVRLSDGQGHETQIYIDNLTGIDTTAIVVGLVQRFVGLSAQLDDLYQTKPRIQADVPGWPSQQGDCPAPAETAPGPLRISAVYYDTTHLGYDELAEAVQVINAGETATSLAGLYLSDNEAQVALPDLWLDPGQKVWLARQEARFTLEFGFAPVWTYGDLAPGLLFDNNGDEALLLNASGAVVDAVVIENGCAVEQSGWSDSSGVYPYRFASYVPADGQILYRKLAEATGRPLPDTDTAADWAQDPNDSVLGRKVLYPGWDLDRFFFPPAVTEDATTTLLVAPDNIYDGIAGLIAEAQSSIDLELYLFTHPLLADALVAAMNRGVHVRLLLEGEVYGAPDGTWDSARWVAKQVYDHPNGEVYFWRNGKDDQGQSLADRYNNAHQKFIIVDGVKAAILSENLSQTAMPHDDKSDGTAGNRGAGIITTAPDVVAHLQAVFAADCDPIYHRDVDAFTPGHDDVRHEPGHEGEPLVRPDEVGNRTGYTPVHPEPLTLNGVTSFEVVQSPETNLRTTDALLGMVARADAGDLVLVQQQYEHQNWGPAGAEFLNPRLEAYVEAARRGARVRIMVANDDDDAYEDELIQFLNDLAAAEGLDLMAGKGQPTAGWLDGEPEGGQIHNKMILVYDGDTQGWMHVGSINGSENAARYNREMALQIGSDAAFDYYAAVFYADWIASGLPGFLDAPVASFAVSDDTPGVGQTVFFTNATTGSAPILYKWNFGDGSPTSTATHPSHAYSAPGVYVVRLHAVNANGESFASAEIRVGYSPLAAFSVSTTTPLPGQTVQFTNASTGAEPLTYQWDLGDGASSEEVNPAHAYSQAGVYLVTLTVRNPWGKDTATATITVQQPLAEYSINHMAIRWHQLDDAADFGLDGRLKLPPSYSRADLNREVILSIRIAGQTFWRRATLVAYDRLWYLSETSDGHGMALWGMGILWGGEGNPSFGRFFAIGTLDVPGLGPDTRPPEATVTLKLLARPDKSPVHGRERVAFRVHNYWWLYAHGAGNGAATGFDLPSWYVIPDALKKMPILQPWSGQNESPQPVKENLQTPLQPVSPGPHLEQIENRIRKAQETLAGSTGKASGGKLWR